MLPAYVCTSDSPRCDSSTAEDICMLTPSSGPSIGCLSTDGCSCYTCQPTYAGGGNPEPSPSGFCNDGGTFYADASTDAASDGDGE
jgi:hypothetical protein